MSDLMHEQVVDYLSNLPAIEVAALIRTLETKWGVSASVPVSSTTPVAVPTSIQEDQTEFSITLADVGPNKINAIKVVREVTGLGLKEAKDLVESVPKMLKENISKGDAEAIVQKFSDIGARIVIQ